MGRCGVRAVHPRPRGEHATQCITIASASGSSPPTRGTLHRPFPVHPAHRFIPAHAGNTHHPSHRFPPAPVHPRPRGEHAICTTSCTGKYGSSPPTRGTRLPESVCISFRRFIPAHAGNTSSPRRSYHSCCGSSPPTRGTLPALLCVHPGLRFIPAHAGNTLRPHFFHFRSRGSSPPTRGTL